MNRYTATSGICTAYGISARSYAEAQAILARTSIPPNFIFKHLLCLIFTLHVQCFSHPFPFPGDNSLRELYLDLFFFITLWEARGIGTLQENGLPGIGHVP